MTTAAARKSLVVAALVWALPASDGAARQQQARSSCQLLLDHPERKPTCHDVHAPAADPSSQRMAQPGVDD